MKAITVGILVGGASGILGIAIVGAVRIYPIGVALPIAYEPPHSLGAAALGGLYYTILLGLPSGIVGALIGGVLGSVWGRKKRR
jgi:hypothetical protein